MQSKWRQRWVSGVLCAVMYSLAWAGDLAEIKRGDLLTVAVYKAFPPYAEEGKGIDVDLAEALAKKLGMRAKVQEYDAAENMDDDLRNIVWRGNFLGLGPAPADVMLHVPIDPTFMQRNPQVKIFAPYYRETLAVIRNTGTLPELASMITLDAQPIGVEADSITDMAVMSYDAGRLRSTVRHYTDIDQAPDDLHAGRIAAFLGTRGQVEPMLAKAGPGFAMSVPPPMAGLPQAGWVHGLAVKAEYQDLAQALQRAVDELDRDGTLDRIFRAHGVTRLKPL